MLYRKIIFIIIFHKCVPRREVLIILYNIPNKKAKIIMLMDILKKYSDDEHPLTTNKIIDKLKDHGLDCERKSIYNSIGSLIDYGMDINKSYKPHPGFYVGERDFELAEIKLLIDAVLSAKFMTSKKTKDLINKLKMQLSNYQAMNLEDQIIIDKTSKEDNEEIYYNIDNVNRAICNRCKITFIYYHKILQSNKIINGNGKLFKVSPYALFWLNDRYYIAGNQESCNTIANYRIDRMKNVKILDEMIRPCSEVSEYKDNFNVADYVKKNVDMFIGKLQEVELICENKFFEILVDKFGADIKLKSNSTRHFSAKLNIYVSEGLVDWLVQNADKVYVESPCELRNKVKKKIKMIYSNYFHKDGSGYLF